MALIVLYVRVACFVALLLLLACILTYKTGGDKEKMSPFECGFDPRGVRRLPFCIKFFLVRIVFLVFDVEVTLIVPMIFAATQVLTFLIVLVLGLVYEWRYGGLHWMV